MLKYSDENIRKVSVYRNLHKNTYSVRDNATKRVCMYCDHLLIRNATFSVSKAGRKRVLLERRKNVHAHVRGELLLTGVEAIDAFKLKAAFNWVDVRYSPYETETFVRMPHRSAIHHSSLVYLAPSGVKAIS